MRNDAYQSITSILNDPGEGPSSGAPWHTVLEAVGLAESQHAQHPPLAHAPSLPRVTLRDFAPYLSRIAEGYPELRRNTRRRSSARPDRTSVLSVDPDGGHNAKPPPAQEDRAAEPASIPEVFFSETFDLAEPDTFAAACGDAGDTPARHSALARLETWEAHVDEKLLREITLRSAALHAEVPGLQRVADAVGAAKEQTHALRGVLAGLGAGRAASIAGEITQLRKVQQRAREALELLEVLSDAQECAASLDLLIASGDHLGALSALESVSEALTAGNAARIHCLRYVRDSVSSSREQVCRLLCAELLSAVRALPEDIAAAAAADVEAGGGPPGDSGGGVQEEEGANEGGADSLRKDGSSPSPLATAGLWVRSLGPLVVAMQPCGELGRALGEWEAQSVADLKQAVWKVVENELRDAGLSSAGSQLVASLRALPHAAFVRMLHRVTRATMLVVEHEERTRGHAEAVLAAAGVASEELQDTQQAMAKALTALGGVACGRVSKLVSSRGPVHARVTLHEMQDVAAAVTALTSALTARGCSDGTSALDRVVVGQSRGWLEAYHERSLSQIIEVLDQEQWRPTEVAAAFQEGVDLLTSNTPPARETTSHAAGDEGMVEDTANGAHAASEQRAGEPAGAREGGGVAGGGLEVCGRRYAATVSLLMLVKALGGYREAPRALPGLDMEASHLMVALLKGFNSRACQLVLGAGAVQMAGLRFISVKHILVAEETMAAVGALRTPMSVEATCCLTPAQQQLALGGWRRIGEDIQLHRKELKAKLVGILSSKIAQLSNSMKSKQDQAAEQPAAGVADASAPSEYAVSVCRQISHVSRACIEVLGAECAAGVLALVARAAAEGATTGLTSVVRSGEGSDVGDEAGARRRDHVMSSEARAQRVRDARAILAELEALPLRQDHRLTCLQPLRMFARG
ncbi:unnamed protein product [Pedinophyceae sp. YPF-701]|nr:unnamed protein product [Pedinophyceae sp. YPF-701]